MKREKTSMESHTESIKHVQQVKPPNTPKRTDQRSITKVKKTKH